MLVPLYPPAYGGAGTQAAHLVRALRRSGVEVRVLAHRPLGSGAPRLERTPGLEIRRFDLPRFDTQRKLWLGLRAALWLLVRRDWDLLHVHGFSYWAALPVIVARLRRRPILVKTTLSRADGPDQPSRLLRASYRRVNAIVALSSELEQSFRSRSDFDVPILRIPNGVDTASFRPARGDERSAARRELELPAEALVIVTAGQLERRKNVVALVEAAGRMSQRPICLVLAGPPPTEEAYAAELALPPGVAARRPGRLEPERLATLLRAADLFALTSRAEGLPNSLLEGMATGLACVATDIPGSRDVLAGGGGWLVPLDDADALVARLDELASRPDERARLGAEALEIVAEQYSIASVAARYLEAYLALVGRTEEAVGTEGGAKARGGGCR
jgi:glycosyltransferase involved in cell wall biosynthesis